MNDKKLLNFIIGELFNGVIKDEVLEITYSPPLPNGQIHPNGIKIGDRQLTTSEIMSLKSQADAIRATELWKHISNRIQFAAQVKSTKNAEIEDKIVFPKGMIYAIQLIEEILKTISGFELQKVGKITK